MGRPFANELARLEQTYARARQQPLGALRAFALGSRRPLLAVGSGGSQSAATYAAFLHEQTTGQLARAATPLEAMQVASVLQRFDALVISAGGRNRDALSACEALLDAEPKGFAVLCASRHSPLASLAQARGRTAVEFEPVGGKDGFLAVNSLLGFAVLLYRAYASERDAELPKDLASLLGAGSLSTFAKQLAGLSQKAAARDSFVVLHGPALRAAAQDMESKFVEAALGSVLVADYRNFAHGRHHWLAKRARTSAVIAFVSDSDEPLAARTLALLPRGAPVVTVRVSGTPRSASIAGLVSGFYLTAEVGRSRGIDPGRPGVPLFGSRLYSLRVKPPARLGRTEIAARRKLIACGLGLEARHDKWRAHANAALKEFAKKRFQGIVVDYDGTLCAPEERFDPLREDIVAQLCRLVDRGIHIGIATGRGRSVTASLRSAIPRTAWPRMLVGYYNGGCVLPLSEEVPTNAREPGAEFGDFLELIRRDSTLTDDVSVESRRWQVTIECKAPDHMAEVWDRVQMHLLAMSSSRFLALRSSHSIDVVAPGVTKVAVVSTLEKVVGGPVIRIGDRGRFPGNDYAMLDSPFGLSVDEVSTSEVGCWNFAPPGVSGIEATLSYLRAMRGQANGFDLDWDQREQ